MKEVRKILVAILLGAVVAAGAFAQKNGDDGKRPPKDTPKVVDKDKEKPPPKNNTPDNSNRRGKPN